MRIHTIAVLTSMLGLALPAPAAGNGTAAATLMPAGRLESPEAFPPLRAPEWLREDLPDWVLRYVGKHGMPPPWSEQPGWIGWEKLGLGRDRYQANRFIVYRPETAEYLYHEYTPLAPAYRRGTLPAFEKILETHDACGGVRAARTPQERAMRLLHEVMPALVRHPQAPPCRPGTAADRELDDEALLESGRAWCNEQARLYVRFCQILGIPARMVFLHGRTKNAHVVAEIHVDGRWRMVDITWQLVFPDSRGRLMSAAEVHTVLGLELATRTYVERWRALLAGPDEALGEADPAVTRRYLARHIADPTSTLCIFGLMNYPLPGLEKDRH